MLYNRLAQNLVSKTTNIYYVTVFVGQEFRSGLAGWLGSGFSWGCCQYVARACGHRKAFDWGWGGLLPGWHPRLAMGRWPLLRAASVRSVWQPLPQACDPRGGKAETTVPLMRSLKVTRHHLCMSLMTQTNLITVGEGRRMVESLGNILENWESQWN